MLQALAAFRVVSEASGLGAAGPCQARICQSGASRCMAASTRTLWWTDSSPSLVPLPVGPQRARARAQASRCYLVRSGVLHKVCRCLAIAGLPTARF